MLIDTKLKRSKFGIGKWKDVVRLQKRTPEKLDLTGYFGDYRKNMAYYLAVAWVFKKELFTPDFFSFKGCEALLKGERFSGYL